MFQDLFLNKGLGDTVTITVTSLGYLPSMRTRRNVLHMNELIVGQDAFIFFTPLIGEIPTFFVR